MTVMKNTKNFKQRKLNYRNNKMNTVKYLQTSWK